MLGIRILGHKIRHYTTWLLRLLKTASKRKKSLKARTHRFVRCSSRPEHISVILNPLEYADLFRTVSRTISEETRTTVQAETPEETSKNVLTTQEK